MTSDVASLPIAEAAERRGLRWPRIRLHVFLILCAVLWLAPVVWTLYTSLRPYSSTAEHGYVSFAGPFTFENYSNAWQQADMPHFFLNSLIITVPAVVITLFFASCIAFVVTKLSWRFNVVLLIVFVAANLLPQQVILTPLYRMYLEIPLPTWLSENGKMYDSFVGLIAIHVAFQVGFCVFVLSNFMRTLPIELTEAALMDGASVWRQYWQVIMPLCRAPLAALATLEFTFIYNDFFWAIVLMQSGDKRPITSALAGLQGAFFTNNNLVAAACLVAALPTLIVYFILQKQFIGGLTLGSTKG